MQLSTYIKRNAQAIRLFLISFVILFFELALIRYIPSQIRYVGFFSNVILIASFFGIGIGSIFHKHIRISHIYIPFVIIGTVVILNFFTYDVVVTNEEVVFYTSGINAINADPTYLFPIIFFLVATAFILPSKLMGDILSSLDNIKGYAINIVGSIAGTTCFSLCSFFNTGPLTWWSILFFTSLLAVYKNISKTHISRIALTCALLIITVLIQTYSYPHAHSKQITDIKTMWSPYYKISLRKIQSHNDFENSVFNVSVNNIGHQNLHDMNVFTNSFYRIPYDIFPNRTYNNALIIGSGAGNDVAEALLHNVRTVTAVDIDPQIIEVGKRYHPNKPYASKNVKIVINDGRLFINNTKEKYDLIIFALTDSLTLSNANSNLRLESYLYTQESIQKTKQILTDDGILVLYNYYRKQWIVDKLESMLYQSFGKQPLIREAEGNLGTSAVLIAGNTSGIQTTQLSHSKITNIPVPTDDWPFLYIKTPSMPTIYLSHLGIILLITTLLVFYGKQKFSIKYNWGLFWMGAAFLLLETKNVVQFSLLFGSTWVTSSLVFTGLLCMLLAAILSTNRLTMIPTPLLYGLFFISILISYIVPQSILLSLNVFWRFTVASLIYFSPIFIANIIFARVYKNVDSASLAYGSNTIGSVVGGFFEYTSLLLGYKQLLLWAGLFYIFSIISFRRQKS